MRRFWLSEGEMPFLSQLSAQAVIAMEGQQTHVRTSKSGNMQQSQVAVLYEIRKSLITEA